MISWKNKTAAAARSLLSCPTLCNPIDGRPPGSPVPGILQARTQEWIAISFSNAWIWKVKLKSLSRVRLFATPWTVAQQAPPSMGFSRQEYWNGLPFLLQGIFPTQEWKPHLHCRQTLYHLSHYALAMQEIPVRSLGQEDPLEKGLATHSSILAWEVPWTEEPVGLQSMGSQRVGHDWATNTLTHSRGKEKLSGDWGKKTSILTDTGPTQLSASSWAGRGSKMAQEGGLILHYCHFFSQWEVTYFY